MTEASAKYISGKEESDKQFEEAGFEWADWNAWRYTWEGDFPTFTIRPGTVNGSNGIVATAELPTDVQVWFPYGTPPTDIKERLNDEILAIMRHAADIQDASLCEPGEWIPF